MTEPPLPHGLSHAHRLGGLPRQLPRGHLVPELTLLRAVVTRMPR
ncbi:hypothetical protein [Tessaracoccus sp. Z1128]